MLSKFAWVIALLSVLSESGFCKPVPDSAGIVPLPDGVAYGGIPYGSISGQLSLYYGDYEPIILGNQVASNEIQRL